MKYSIAYSSYTIHRPENVMLYAARNLPTGECNFGLLRPSYTKEILPNILECFPGKFLFSLTSLISELFVTDDVSNLLTTEMPYLILASVIRGNLCFK